jgi:hypothetical protein
MIVFSLFGGTDVSNQGFTLAKQALYSLDHASSPFCSDYFGDGGLKNYLLRPTSNCDPPSLSIPNS